MKMTDQEIYQKFIDYMDNPIWEFTESKHKMPMIASFITPEEANFLTGFPFIDTSLKKIAAIKKMDPAEAAPKIEALCRKGLIYEIINGNSARYRLWSAAEMFLRVPFWSGEGGKLREELAYNTSRYYDDGWYDQHKPFAPVEIRPLPVNETVEAGTELLPYEDILKVVDNFEYYSVSQCICRERYRLDADSVDSPFPLETCLHFDNLGRYCVENGHGRKITREETLEILKIAADAGLVHGIANHEQNPETI